MVTGPLLLVAFVAAIALLLTLIIRFRADPFLALLITAILTAIAVGMPVGEIGKTVSDGFGNTLAGIGIVIGLGVVLGQLLMEAEATDEISRRLLMVTGEKRSPLAVNLTGYLASIPVFLDAAFVIFMPLVRRLAQRTTTAWITFVTALSVGLISTHAMAIPTPGPLAVAVNLDLDAGVFLLYALVVSLIAALVGGWGYGLLIGRNAAPLERTGEEDGALPELAAPRARPSAGLSLWVLLLPVGLILVGSVLRLFLPADSPAAAALGFVGDKNVALLLGVLFAAAMLRRFIARPMAEIVSNAAASAGMILLITGAGGAFGNVIRTSGIGQYLVDTMTAWHVSPLALGFVLSAILRAAQGSTTVALITVSAILGPALEAGGGVSPVLVGLAICAGGMCASLPNDSGFWVVSRFSGLSARDTLRSWSAGGTIAGITAFLLILLLSAVADSLPGLSSTGNR